MLRHWPVEAIESANLKINEPRKPRIRSGVSMASFLYDSEI